jgi:hypothetical protein
VSVPPAGRLAGSLVDCTVNAPLELLSCAMSIADVPWFLIVTFWEAGLPIFTSPKSTVRGLRFKAVAFEDENA